ncbi:MAG TPA: DoxX family protein [Puia sp.]|nr:DoxX family protein [Puia sp.]
MENVAKRSKARSITYWVFTGYLAFESVFSATWDFNWLNKGFATGIMHHLGYPPYFQVIKGIGTLLAAPVFVLPGLPVLKEWAYFGTFLIYIGAIASHLAMGDGVFAFVGPVLFLAIAVTSWALRPGSRRLAMG